MHNHGLLLIVCGLRDLRVDILADFNSASGLRQLDSVRALRALFHLGHEIHIVVSGQVVLWPIFICLLDVHLERVKYRSRQFVIEGRAWQCVHVR